MSEISRRAAKLIVPAVALAIAAWPFHASFAGPQDTAFTRPCVLDDFTANAQKNGWIVQELTDEERVNFLDHLNRDDGVSTNFYPPHLWETVRKQDERIHIRIVFLDARNCVLGNSGEIGFNELSYLLAPNEGF